MQNGSKKGLLALLCLSICLLVTSCRRRCYTYDEGPCEDRYEDRSCRRGTCPMRYQDHEMMEDEEYGYGEMRDYKEEPARRHVTKPRKKYMRKKKMMSEEPMEEMEMEEEVVKE